MKPRRIFLVRHGQSQGNADPKMYETIPDYALRLTDLGIQQATEAGKKLKSIIGNKNIQFYVSPLFRTRQTFENIAKSFDWEHYRSIEEPRIREQEWGHCRSLEESKRLNEERDAYGTFYYRIPDGESGADVYDRMASFFGTLHRDFEKEYFPPNVVIVSHGLTMRLFLMKWFHLTVEQFEMLKNPHNCQIVELTQNFLGKYEITQGLEKYDGPKNPKFTY